MGKRIRTKNKKMKRDQARAYSQKKAPYPHKISIARSKRALKKKAYRMV